MRCCHIFVRRYFFAEPTAAIAARCRRLIILAAAVLAALLCAGTVLAVGAARGSRMSDELEFTSRSDLYAQYCGETLTRDNVSVELTDVLSENERLYVKFHFTVTGADGVWGADFDILADSSFTVDGNEERFCGYGGVGSFFDIVREYDLSNMRSGEWLGEHEFTLSFENVRLFDDSGSNHIVRGPWEFSFKYNVRDLSAETVEYIINETVEFPSGDKVYLDRIECTPVAQRLYYYGCAENRNDEGHLGYIYARDDLGGEYCFCMTEEKSGVYPPSDDRDRYAGIATNVFSDNFSTDARTIELRISLENPLIPEASNPPWLELPVGENKYYARRVDG